MIDADALREAFVKRVTESIGGESAARIIAMFDWALAAVPPEPDDYLDDEPEVPSGGPD